MFPLYFTSYISAVISEIIFSKVHVSMQRIKPKLDYRICGFKLVPGMKVYNSRKGHDQKIMSSLWQYAEHLGQDYTNSSPMGPTMGTGNISGHRPTAEGVLMGLKLSEIVCCTESLTSTNLSLIFLSTVKSSAYGIALYIWGEMNESVHFCSYKESVMQQKSKQLF